MKTATTHQRIREAKMMIDRQFAASFDHLSAGFPGTLATFRPLLGQVTGISTSVKSSARSNLGFLIRFVSRSCLCYNP